MTMPDAAADDPDVLPDVDMDALLTFHYPDFDPESTPDIVVTLKRADALLAEATEHLHARNEMRSQLHEAAAEEAVNILNEAERDLDADEVAEQVAADPAVRTCHTVAVGHLRRAADFISAANTLLTAENNRLTDQSDTLTSSQ